MSRSINALIKSGIADVFRKLSIKRRSLVDGTFESSWFDITKDVKQFGKVTKQIDSARRNMFTFGTAKITMQNESGAYNPHDNPSSHWYGYLNQQRTLVKIEAGFLDPVKDANGIWSRNENPRATLWDEALFDNPSEDVFDDYVVDAATVFIGIISGDLPLSDKNQVVFNLRPLVSVFQDFPAQNLTGYTSTGMTASQFVTMVRDQTDSLGNYIFRPFFGDTTTYWDISTTATVFTTLNTSTSTAVLDKTVWEVIEKLSEAENFVPYISKNGTFKFVSRNNVEASPIFEFHGAGSFSSTYGNTIKEVVNYGFKISKYYSRVQLKFRDDDTTSSYSIFESTMTVSPFSNPWVLGVRTLSIENLFVPTASADALTQTIFNDVSAFKKEIEFTTSFVPHLDLFDRFSIYYDPGEFNIGSFWDQKNWAADGADDPEDLIWDISDGDAILLEGEEFKFLSFEIDLDNFQNRFIAREI